ncbi:MAG: hypothetical protein KH760_00300 [Clostridiales bacterium]|nr:hypothetical protein [Clostridiales bacterium]
MWKRIEEVATSCTRNRGSEFCPRCQKVRKHQAFSEAAKQKKLKC